jgi:hypothetical protein
VSPSKNGYIKARDINPQIIKINPKISLVEKYGWNGILSLLELTPSGLFDPVWCKNSRCTIDIPATIKGSKK